MIEFYPINSLGVLSHSITNMDTKEFYNLWVIVVWYRVEYIEIYTSMWLQMSISALNLKFRIWGFQVLESPFWPWKFVRSNHLESKRQFCQKHKPSDTVIPYFRVVWYQHVSSVSFEFSLGNIRSQILGINIKFFSRVREIISHVVRFLKLIGNI